MAFCFAAYGTHRQLSKPSVASSC